MYNKSIKEVYEQLKTSEEGLEKKEALKRLEKYGLNQLTENRRRSSFKIFLDQFKDLMIIILIIVDVFMFIYALLFSHDYIDAIVISTVIMINIIMGYIQENKAEVNLKNLLQYTKTNVKVIRENDVDLVDSKEIVKGDIIKLEAGDLVPVDARIIECSNLSADESTLTGESFKTIKTEKKLKGKLELQDRKNMLLSGTNILSGSAKAVVCETAMNTQIGKIAASLNTPYRVATPLENKILELSKKITILIFIVLIIAFIYNIINGKSIIDNIMMCVSLAVAAIPEGLPAVITICLSSGTSAMLKRKTIVRQMNSIEKAGSLNVICSDKTGTITQNKMTVKELLIYDKNILFKTFSLCNESIIEDGNIIGDPTETCLFNYLKKQKINPDKIRKESKRLETIPFDSDRKMMTTVNKIDNKKFLLVKGSNIEVIEKCKYIMEEKKQLLTKEKKEKIYENIKKMQDKSLRVMSFAYKEINEIPNNIETEEKDLTLSGIVGIIDPPRKDVKLAIKKCKKAHIRPIMITGDSLNTASAIALEVGIIKDKSEAIEGKELDKYNEEEIINVIDKYNVYARVSPKHKELIVHILQKKGKVVAMTGDGVNDAPAIKDADIGIGMGITGTDVTKNVSDIILLDDSFSTIINAVEEGRRIFSNIRKNIVYTLSSNVSELIIILIGIIFDKTLLLPIHILFIDLITDSIPSIALAFEPKEKDIMKEKPKDKNYKLFTPFILANVISSAIIETIFVLVSYFLASDYGDNIIQSVILLSLVMQEIIYAISVRNLKQPILKQGLFSNKTMNISIIFLIIIELIFFITPLRQVINITLLPLNLAILIIFANMLSFIVYELEKPIIAKKFKD